MATLKRLRSLYGPSAQLVLLVSSSITVLGLRKLIAEYYQLPLEKLKLIMRGNVFHDSKSGQDVNLHLKDGDSLIVAFKPKPPAKHLQGGLDDDDDDDDLKFQLPQSSSRWKRRVYAVLHDKLKLPDILLMAILSLSLKMWVIIIMWFILAPVVHRWDVGPLYILGQRFWYNSSESRTAEGRRCQCIFDFQ